MLSRKRSRNTKRRRIINGTLSWTIREDLAPHGWPQLLSAVSRKNTWVIGTTGRDRGVGTSHRLRSAFFLGQSDVQLPANRHGPHSCQFSMCWTTAVRSLFICLLNQVYLPAYTVGLQSFLDLIRSDSVLCCLLVSWFVLHPFFVLVVARQIGETLCRLVSWLRQAMFALFSYLFGHICP